MKPPTILCIDFPDKERILAKPFFVERFQLVWTHQENLLQDYYRIESKPDVVLWCLDNDFPSGSAVQNLREALSEGSSLPIYGYTKEKELFDNALPTQIGMDDFIFGPIGLQLFPKRLEARLGPAQEKKTRTKGAYPWYYTLA